jgi:hypothetical protein
LQQKALIAGGAVTSSVSAGVAPAARNRTQHAARSALPAFATRSPSGSSAPALTAAGRGKSDSKLSSRARPALSAMRVTGGAGAASSQRPSVGCIPASDAVSAKAPVSAPVRRTWTTAVAVAPGSSPAAPDSKPAGTSRLSSAAPIATPVRLQSGIHAVPPSLRSTIRTFHVPV